MVERLQYKYVGGQSKLIRACRKPSKGRTVEINKLKRQKQYRYEREQSEPAGTCEKQRNCSFSLSTAVGRG